MPLPVVFQKQVMMRKVLMALSPAFVASIYFFGWISAVVVFASMLSCTLTEWLFVRKGSGKVSEAVWVSGMLLGLIMPPTLPLWMVALAGIFAITFGKMAFGGFGANIFNPAMVGRAFVYISFPVHMTARWVPAANFSDFPGGFASWRFSPALADIASVTTATPSHAYRFGAETLPSIMQVLLGNINGTFDKLGETVYIGGGSLGETSALLLAVGGTYLLVKKVAKWRLVASFFASYLIVQTIFHYWVPELVSDTLYGFLTGGAVLGGFFMVTDPVSAPKTEGAQWLYGAFIAVMTNVIRTFSLFAGGLMFSILLGNMFAPLFDYSVKAVRAGRKTV